MTKRFMVRMSVEEARDLFVREMVQRKSGTVGLELNMSGFVDARRRFVLALQGWERNLWMRPLLTRLEGHFERSPNNDVTTIVFDRRGLTLPLFVLAWLLPYTVARNMIPEWPPTLYQGFMVGVSVVLILIAVASLYWVEQRVHRLLIKGLTTIYGNPPLEDL